MSKKHTADFSPERLGPGVWWVIHSFAYRQSPIYPQLIAELSQNLFCEKCQSEFNKLLSQLPLIPDNPKTWAAWSVNIHNLVDIRLGHKTFSLSKADELYSSQNCASCSREK